MNTKDKVQTLTITVTTKEDKGVSIDMYCKEFSLLELIGLLKIQLDNVQKQTNSLS